MKKRFIRFGALVLALVMTAAMFSACNNETKEEVPIDQLVDAAVQAALEAAVVPTTVTIDADGQKITIEDTDGKSIQQLLDQANIALEEGDLLSLSPAQSLTGNIEFQVLRQNTVVVNAFDTQYTVVLMGGDVADALQTVGVTLAENHLINLDLETVLEDGMEIVITEMEEEEEEQTEATEATEPKKNSSSSSSKPSSSKPSSSKPSSSKPSTSKPTETKPAETKPAETKPAETKPAETKPSKTVVNVEIYEDCDGSGHGVKVITYSDGSQEEVPF